MVQGNIGTGKIGTEKLVQGNFGTMENLVHWKFCNTANSSRLF